jgi:hypothetical protein
MDRKIKILKGRAKSFDLFIQDEKGNPKDITGWSMIRLKIQHSKGFLTKYAPISPGVNEIQRVDLKDPDLGSFKLKFQDETTGSLAFNAGAAAIQTALNALSELSGVTVVDNGLGVYDVTFAGNDGSRAQPLLTVVESTLEDAGDLVAPTVTELTAGRAENGISVVEVKCGQIRVKLSKEDVDLLDIKNDQSIDLYVRIGTEDLDLDPDLLDSILDVLDPTC